MVFCRHVWSTECELMVPSFVAALEIFSWWHFFRALIIIIRYNHLFVVIIIARVVCGFGTIFQITAASFRQLSDSSIDGRNATGRFGRSIILIDLIAARWRRTRFTRKHVRWAAANGLHWIDYAMIWGAQTRWTGAQAMPVLCVLLPNAVTRYHMVLGRHVGAAREWHGPYRWSNGIYLRNIVVILRCSQVHCAAGCFIPIALHINRFILFLGTRLSTLFTQTNEMQNCILNHGTKLEFNTNSCQSTCNGKLFLNTFFWIFAFLFKEIKLIFSPFASNLQHAVQFPLEYAAIGHGRPGMIDIVNYECARYSPIQSLLCACESLHANGPGDLFESVGMSRNWKGTALVNSQKLFIFSLF